MNRVKLAAITISSLLLAAAPAAAQTVGPVHGASVSACTFGTSCSSAAGSADEVCAISTAGSQTITVSNFGFDMPVNAGTIEGFFVEPRIIDAGCQGTIQLLKDNAPVGIPRDLPSYFANTCDLAQYFSFGGFGDKWGSTWTVEDVEDSDFGVQIANAGCTGVGVDTVRVSVYYNVSEDLCDDGYVTGDETCEDGNTADGDGCSSNCRIEVALTEDQQSCVNTTNGGLAKIVKATAKVLSKCHKAYAKDGSAFSPCVDDSDKVEKVYLKLVNTAGPLCEEADPPFGYTSVLEASPFAYAVAEANYVDLVETYPDDLVTGDKAASGCQAAVLGAKHAITGGVIASFNKCKKAALLGKKVPQATSSVALGQCLAARADDAELGVLSALQKKCAGQPLEELLSGLCSPSASDQARADCLANRAYCYACVLMNAADGLNLACDQLDNGAIDSSCEDLTGP